MTLEPHRPVHLDQLRQLMNCHLAGVVPGWRLPVRVIEASLGATDDEGGLDPWVTERRTVCATESGRLVGAAHVVRYGPGPEVGSRYRGAAELAWLLFWPEAGAAARALVAAAAELAAAWRATQLYAYETALPVPVVTGVPESWPHVSTALTTSGFEPLAAAEEVIYGGRLPESCGGVPPVAGLEVRAATDQPGRVFRALRRGVEVASVEWAPDLSCGGSLPALAGWAELVTVEVEPAVRGRGIASWLIRRTVPFLRMVGVRRVVVALTAAEEAAGAGRLCRRLGWEPVVRLEQGWAAEA
ncbi:MAG TPA: GNAT family N-acetyltransferase [Candidatus Dormibacteraeota bacterium]|nr:GNAT family N-acetyltransferase [Candidatus Dormibacteraeota bacterium]